MASFDNILLQSHCRKISFKSRTEVLGEMQSCHTTDTESGTFGRIIIRIVATELITGMQHHTSGKALDEFLFLCDAIKTEYSQYNSQDKAFHNSIGLKLVQADKNRKNSKKYSYLSIQNR